ncbi:MAG: hypothetical protein M3347_07825 [Armatimonadota bacterium]|nr:hypothetical protein [Armatimonadota bacterium]
MRFLARLFAFLILLGGLAYGSYAFGRYVLSTRLFGDAVVPTRSGLDKVNRSTQIAASMTRQTKWKGRRPRVELEVLPADSAGPGPVPPAQSALERDALRERAREYAQPEPRRRATTTTSRESSSSSSDRQALRGEEPVSGVYKEGGYEDEDRPRRRRRRRRSSTRTAMSTPALTSPVRSAETLSPDVNTDRIVGLGSASQTGNGESSSPRSEASSPATSSESVAPRRRRRTHRRRTESSSGEGTRARRSTERESPVPRPEGSSGGGSDSPIPQPEE